MYYLFLTFILIFNSCNLHKSTNTQKVKKMTITQDSIQPNTEKILDIFWHVHDPTTLNRQGNDVGTQYRSVIFYRNEVQKNIAVASIAAAEKEGIWADKIVTTLEPFKQFYIAENYHQNYFKDNPNQPYCIYVVSPKVEKFKRKYKDKLK